MGNIPAPSGLVVDNNGNIFVASFSESKIIKISRDGLTKIVYADKTKGIDGPIGMAIDSMGNIYVANYNKGNISVIDKDGNSRVLMFVKKPYGLILDEDKAKLHITEQQNNSVITYDVSDIIKTNKKHVAEESKLTPAVEKQSEIRPVIHEMNFTTKTTTPTMIESSYTRGTSSGITAPIMIPSNGEFD